MSKESTRKVFTKENLKVLTEKYLTFELGASGALEVTSRVDNPTYISNTRTNTVGHYEMFKLRSGEYSITCLKSVMVEAMRHGVHPIEMMLMIHNYGVRTNMYTTHKTLDKVMKVVEILLKDETDCSLEERIVKLQATIE